jgi:hypothetical protein
MAHFLLTFMHRCASLRVSVYDLIRVCIGTVLATLLYYLGKIGRIFGGFKGNELLSFAKIIVDSLSGLFYCELWPSKQKR